MEAAEANPVFGDAGDEHREIQDDVVSKGRQGCFIIFYDLPLVSFTTTLNFVRNVVFAHTSLCTLSL